MNSLTVDRIRHHYDGLSPFYRAFWGEHIHHGYFENGESPPQAQLNLIERLASQAKIKPGAQVLDVGCGLGGSSLWLARNLDCSVQGLTLSPVQAALAAKRAEQEGLSKQVHFEVKDVNNFSPFPESYDVVWTIECSEHLFDKSRFVHSYANALRRGGVFALCAWQAGRKSGLPEEVRKVSEICRANLCPSFATMEEYVHWMKKSGLTEIEAKDITGHVSKTWDYCLDLVARTEIKLLLRTLDQETRRFVQAFALIKEAYANGSMSYGMITAVK